MTIELSPADGVLGRLLQQPQPGVRRVSFDVDGEQVTFVVRSGRLTAVCTCGADGCEHYGAVLRVVGEEPADSSVSSRALVPVQALGGGPGPRERSAEALSAAFDELCLATVRAGVVAPDSPSITAALDQLVAAAPKPVPVGLARWIGRFHDALGFGDVGKVARLLDGAQRGAARLWEGKRAAGSFLGHPSWLAGGEGGLLEPMSELTLVEIAREWVRGLSRSAIERRYLIDLNTAEVFCEERRRGEFSASVGPCPRVVHVAFGEADGASLPRRARLLQYTVTPELNEAEWLRLGQLGETDVAALGAWYITSSERCPGLSEPFVLLAAPSLDPGSDGALRDRHGRALELRDDEDRPQADVVRALIGDAELVWICGRLQGWSRGLLLRPASLLVRAAGRPALRRVT